MTPEMKLYSIEPRNRLFELFSILNRQNHPENKAIALREIDLSAVEAVRETLDRTSVRPSYTSFMVKAVATTLREMPRANRAAIEVPFFKRIYRFKSQDVTTAVERNDGGDAAVFVYTVRDAASKSLNEIDRELKGLSTTEADSDDPRLERWRRMRQGIRLAPFNWILSFVFWLHKNIPSLHLHNRGGAALISSPSKYGVDCIVADWPYPLGLSFGLIRERPWVAEGRLVVRKTTTITLAFDRRLITGAEASRFMNRLCTILETATFNQDSGSARSGGPE